MKLLQRGKTSRVRLGFFLLCILAFIVVMTMFVSSFSKVKVIRFRAFDSELNLRFGTSSDADGASNNSPLVELEAMDIKILTAAPKASAEPSSHPTTPWTPGQKAKQAGAAPSKGAPAKDAKPANAPASKTQRGAGEKKKPPAKPPAKPPNVGVPASKKGGPRKRYIIYQCDDTRWCGGLGDRQRGLISTFTLAQVLNRTFGINMTTPCNLNLFLRPNKVPWDIDPAELEGLSQRTLDTFDRNGPLYPAIINGSVDTVFPEDVLRIKTNGDLLNQIRKNPRLAKLVPKWAASHSEEMGNGWRMLTKPSEHILEHYRDIFKKVKGPDNDKNLICAHVRMARNPTMPNDGASRFAVRDLEKLWSFVEPYVANGTHFFLATDSEKVRNIARARFENMLIDTDGKILHIDRQRYNREACDAFELAVFEQYILSTCKYLIVCPSNFSGKALDFRGSLKNAYYFSPTGVSKIKSIR